MKRIKIEFQVTILTVIIALAVIFSGYLVYQSLSQIVGSIHKEARPDFKLLLIKDVALDLTEVENTVRLYTLTGDEKYFHPYKKINQSIQEKLTNLQDYSLTSDEESMQIDSIRLLTNEKLLVWQKILALHHSKGDTHESFSELYSKIDSSKIEPDTILIEAPEEKVGLFKKIFGGKKKQPELIEQIQPVDTNIIEKESIKQKIAEIEQKIQATNKALQVREKIFLEENIEITELLNQLINELETNEQKKLLQKTQEADRLAAITYKRLALFTIAAIILLLLVLFLFYRFLDKSRATQTILQKAKTEAEKLARAKELFVATVSHEMRTPINAIYGLTEQLTQRSHTNKTKKDLEIIHKSAEHLISLVNDTLDFSKIETQKLQLDKIDFSLNEILTEVITLNQNNANKKQLELKLDTRNLPPLVLLGDAFRLKQVLINLINNAIKFTDNGQVTLQVSASEKDLSNVWVTFRIIDTGIGISKENHELIFDDFVQVETDITKKQGGAGLGLSIVKKLIDIQEGKISINSELNQGTTISVEIPYKKGNPKRIKTIVRNEITIPESFENLSILNTDDDDFNRHLLKSVLEKWGIRVTEATNGQEAVNLCSQQSFDLIFMDIRMPVLNGFDASKQILKSNPQAKIVALTATNKPEDIEKCKQAGMPNFLSKPFSEQELFNVLQKTIQTENNTEKQQQKAPDTIDLSELERMANGDPVFVKEMIEIFIHSSESGLLAIRKNLQLRNWESISDHAHKMAAPAKHMKLSTLYSKIKLIELEATKTQNENMINQIFIELELEVNKTNKHLKDILKSKFQN